MWSGIFYQGGPGDEPGRACGDGRSRTDRSIGTAAMCAARTGALGGLSPGGSAGPGRVGVDAVDCQTALNWDPGLASNRNPSRALEQACLGSEREGPARSGATATSLA